MFAEPAPRSSTWLNKEQTRSTQNTPSNTIFTRTSHGMLVRAQSCNPQPHQQTPESALTKLSSLNLAISYPSAGVNTRMGLEWVRYETVCMLGLTGVALHDAAIGISLYFHAIRQRVSLGKYATSYRYWDIYTHVSHAYTHTHTYTCRKLCITQLHIHSCLSHIHTHIHSCVTRDRNKSSAPERPVESNYYAQIQHNKATPFHP